MRFVKRKLWKLLKIISAFQIIYRETRNPQRVTSVNHMLAMGRNVKALIWTLLILVGASDTSIAQESSKGIYVIFDASGSMWGQLADRSYKIHVAREVLGDFLSGDFGDAELAFRAYGHRQKGDCRDSELVAPFSAPAEAADRVKPFLSEVDPLGKTPIAYSLDQALNDFDGREGEIILITDGIETCDADPCAMVRDWKSKGVKVNVHVVGFGLAEEEKSALQCIADAAGTPFREAESGMDLSMGLEAIQESIDGLPGEPPSNGSVGLWLRGITKDGTPIRIEGTLQREDMTLEVSSNSRNQVPAGAYTLLAGVRTADGTLYAPITRPISIESTEDTEVVVEVELPPSVYAQFVSEGEPVRGSQITAFQDDVQVFRFRWMDEVFVKEGTYTFRAAPNEDNELELTETVEPGERQELQFVMQPTVRAKFNMIASSTGERLRGNFILWQNGEERYKVHTHNGANIVAGAYDVHLQNDLVPHVAENIEVNEAGEINIEVPTGQVTFVYQDAAGNRVDDKRVFVGRGTDRQSDTVQSGQSIVLLPGTHNARGWPARNGYEPVVFEIHAGETLTLVLKAKQ